MKTCKTCGLAVKPYQRSCPACGSISIRRQAPSKATQKRHAAHTRLLWGMDQPPCVCGCRGPHECTRTVEWQQDMLFFMRARQL